MTAVEIKSKQISRFFNLLEIQHKLSDVILNEISDFLNSGSTFEDDDGNKFRALPVELLYKKAKEIQVLILDFLDNEYPKIGKEFGLITENAND